MNGYLVIKCLHILSATVLMGTGVGIAWFKWMADRSGDVRAIRITNEHTVIADLMFTTPAVLLQPITGLALIHLAGYPHSGWPIYAMCLYLLAGACWLPVIWLQVRMRDLARAADALSAPLSPQYWRYARIWFWLGLPAFSGLIVVFWLMVGKPA
ncbi:DUF2269 family protein [Pseudomonas sp. OV226]|uniref:DUF2269 family protein n=1 Tax=Pseudomonas sp. OV226 TaxID=2135588 RepID=UPI000D6D25DA|nr:DUF2269 domain-containing protein [Pseudomonas sp. OV226]PWK28760.1 putative membrane protein [Pseudomonas sp. OV226]